MATKHSGIVRTFSHFENRKTGEVFRVNLEVDLDRLMARLAKRVMENRTGKAVLADGMVKAVKVKAQ